MFCLGQWVHVGFDHNLDRIDRAFMVNTDLKEQWSAIIEP